MYAVLFKFTVFTFVKTKYSHVLLLCIQAHTDVGLTLAYAAPEDVRRLGRGECCGSATTTASNMPCENDGGDATWLK